MEEPQDRITSGNDRSEKTAETLRALRSLADQTLGNHRRRLSTIESTLNVQLQQIADELARDDSVSEIEAAAYQLQLEELERCRESLSQAEEELATLRNQLAANSVDREAALAESKNELERLQEQYQHEEAERKQLAAELDEKNATLAALEAETQSLRDQQSAKAGDYASQVAKHAEELTKREQECQQKDAEIERLNNEIDASRDQTSQAAYERDCLAEELQSTQNNLEKIQRQECEQCATSQQQIVELEQQQSAASAERQALEQQLGEIEEHQRHTQKALETAEATREETATSLQVAEQRNQELTEQIEQQQAEAAALQQSLEQQLHEVQQQQQQTQQALEGAEVNIEKADALLQDAEQRILELSANTEIKDELDQTNRKFELALADVQKLKHENAELNAELTQRPEVDDQETPELVSLRAERDALACRVAELESIPATLDDSDTQQEMADLQRRFELAVDDVRELKKENAELLSKIESAPSSPVVRQSTEGLDWQAQKALLMAELDAEEEGGAIVTPERQEERATIEGTISITDRMVAEKDQEILELKAQLEASAEANEPSAEEVQRVALDELFDRDELIQAERTRLEQVQQEWQEKLREAELEISVQRATLARERASLEEKFSKMQENSPEVESDSGGKPRHRWLSALGLKDDDND